MLDVDDEEAGRDRLDNPLFDLLGSRLAFGPGGLRVGRLAALRSPWGDPEKLDELNAEQRGEGWSQSLFWLAAAVFAAVLWGWTILEAIRLLAG